jgi:hypothetical protein
MRVADVAAAREGSDVIFLVDDDVDRRSRVLPWPPPRDGIDSGMTVLGRERLRRENEADPIIAHREDVELLYYHARCRGDDITPYLLARVVRRIMDL